MITTSIQPWITVSDSDKAITFYKAAFNAVETYRMDDESGGTVVKLSVNGVEFWVSGETDNKPIVGNAVRMILVVDDPERILKQAIDAGAKEIFPVGEGHGWRLGRIEDPFGLHWEIGHQL